MKKYLLDTHVILWWLANDPKLSGAAQRVLADPGNTLLVSSVSGYEIAWKARIGKLVVPFQTPTEFSRAFQREGWIELPLLLGHTVDAGRFHNLHRDPFDRQLAAQAICEGATLITIDPVFKSFPKLVTLW